MSAGGVVAALDIGGTHVSAGRVDLARRAVEAGSRARIELQGTGCGPELLSEILRAASAVVRPDVDRVGIAIPGPFDYDSGVSRMEHKLLGLYGVDLRSELCEALALPASALRFVNDAEAFLIGEWWAGAARDHVRAVGITLGTGLVSAFLADGRIARDGPEVPPGGQLYTLSFRGAPVEDTVSSRGLLRACKGRDAGLLDVEGIAVRAATGEPRARRAFEELGRALGEFLAPWLERFQPTCLVVGGSIARSWQLFEQSLRTELESVAGLETVTPAAHIDDAPLLGVAWQVGGAG